MRKNFQIGSAVTFIKLIDIYRYTRIKMEKNGWTENEKSNCILLPLIHHG